MGRRHAFTPLKVFRCFWTRAPNCGHPAFSRAATKPLCRFLVAQNTRCLEPAPLGVISAQVIQRFSKDILSAMELEHVSASIEFEQEHPISQGPAVQHIGVDEYTQDHRHDAIASDED